MSDLAAFLLARLAEEEAEANAATTGPWEFEGDDPTDDELWGGVDADDGPFCIAYVRGDRPVQNGFHMARWHPARVLAECEARRKVLVRWEIWNTVESNGRLRDDAWARATRLVLDGLMRDLAAPFASHPDFDPAWTVGGQGD